VPIFGVRLTGGTGVGAMAIARLCLRGNVGGGSAFFCASGEGEMVSADWHHGTGRPAAGSGPGGGGVSNPAGGAAAGGGQNGKTAGGVSNPGAPGGGGPQDAHAPYIRWTAEDHFRPSVALERSPFFSDVLLSVGDRGFHLWREGSREPIFRSPPADARCTAGRWSPTRAGVILVAKASGDIDVWDLTDSSHRPLQEIHVGSVAVASMEFWQPNDRSLRDGSGKQLLAVGDVAGAMHVVDMPPHLRSRPGGHGAAQMGAYLDREQQQLAYAGLRRQVRAREKEKLDEAAAEEDGEKEGGKSDAERAKEQAAADAAAEREYQAIEAKFRAMFAAD
jgi:hypothetical protein